LQIFVKCASKLQGQIQEFSLGGTMVSALCEPITGVWGRDPSGVQGQEHSLFRCPKEGESWFDFSVVLKLVQQSKCVFSIGTPT